MHHWKIWYFHNTVKPHFTDTGLIRTPWSLLWTVCFVPEKRKPLWQCWKDRNVIARAYHGLQPQWRNPNSFNNNKLLALQDECDMNTQEEENMCTQYTIVSLNFIPQALPAGITCKLNSTDNLWTLSVTLSVSHQQGLMVVLTYRFTFLKSIFLDLK